MISHTILVVDDDIPLTKTIAATLKQAGYRVLSAHTAEDGLVLASVSKPDLAILDVMVPNMGGLELCRSIRAYSNMPIIFLSALGEVDQVVGGLELGADDYMVKPFKSPELLARIKAQLRRAPANAALQHLVFDNGALEIDLEAHQVTLRGQIIDLTPREYDLLLVLASNAGRVITTNELSQKAWGISQGEAGDNIKPYIHYLRKKIEDDPASPSWILTVRGVGYRFAEP